MSVKSEDTRPTRWARLSRRTVRFQITLLYGGLFVVTGAALLAITYFLVRHAIGNPKNPLSQVQASSIGNAQSGPGQQGCAVTPFRQSYSGMSLQLSAIMRTLLTNSGVALAIMAVLSVALGWLMAGRMLRPLRTITSSVRDISATNLHRRLTVNGPADELKELGDTFDSLLDRLERAFQAHRQFVANASHELRTPLARQRVIGQVALADPEATVETLRAAHERILVAGALQERMIEALLTMTRGQTGLETREPVDLAQLTDEVIEARRSEADYRGVRLRPDISPAVIAGHRHLAERLVVNLVDNALRYNHTGGWVSVSTATLAGRPALTITNTGPVVSTDAVGDLFQPFHRLGDTRAAKADGLGLGLSIVRAIADAHDATVDVVAQPDGGLMITVRFPAVINSAAALPGREQKVPGPTAGSPGLAP